MFGQFDDWSDPGLSLPIGGREFRANPSALAILNLHRLRNSDEPVNDGTERDAIISVLGPAWDEMRAAEIPEAYALHAGRTVLTHYLKSASDAIAVWRFEPESEPEPEPEPAARPEPTIWNGQPDDDRYDPPGTINEFDPGGGPYRPKYGDRVWSNPIEMAPAYRKQQDQGVEREQPTWTDIFAVWDSVEVDFAELLRIDLTPEILDARPWRWFAVRLSRIVGDPHTLTSRLISVRKAVE